MDTSTPEQASTTEPAVASSSAAAQGVEPQGASGPAGASAGAVEEADPGAAEGADPGTVEEADPEAAEGADPGAAGEADSTAAKVADPGAATHAGTGAGAATGATTNAREAAERTAAVAELHAWNGQRAARIKRLGRYVAIRRFVTLCCVFCSALLQAFVIQSFVNPANLLSSGFTGLAILIDRITQLFGVSFPTSLGMIALNLPVAAICWRSISKRFVVFSMLQVFLASAFLRFCTFEPLLDNTILCVLFGGVLQGLVISIALKSGASTAGTDFIALMVSNRTGKTIWQYVFVFNCSVLVVFGLIFGWEHAAYSIIFQFLSTKTIDSFYHRYDRVTLQITTEHADKILPAYSRMFHHGSTRFKAQGGYSGKPLDFIVTVVSAYEADDIVRFIRYVDPHAVINVCKTENFVGNFHRAPADEPLPVEAEDTPKNDPVLEFMEAVRSNVERESTRPRRRYFNG